MKKAIMYEDLIIMPVHVCGYNLYDHHGNLIEQKLYYNCKNCNMNMEETPGGRRREIVCLNPEYYDGYEVELIMLTRRERERIEEYLGQKSSDYVLPASVHSYWKKGRNQGVIVVAK